MEINRYIAFAEEYNAASGNLPNLPQKIGIKPALADKKCLTAFFRMIKVRAIG